MTSARQKVKEIIRGRLASVGITGYSDRYCKTSKPEFATIYFGEWTTQPETMEAVDNITTGEIQVEIFSKAGDARLEELSEKVRSVLDYDTTLQGYVRYFYVTGGEYTPQVPGELPSLLMSYRAEFNDETLAQISAAALYHEAINYMLPEQWHPPK
ncbi:hypothetical protein [Endozoicomonas sp. Mp262]|uniref:hypothetical protein n=1 Tax=Endozoicomonas sp. Mp262 TaxID=2919499 RepID=UPI0021DB5C72